MQPNTGPGSVTVTNLMEFFRDALRGVLYVYTQRDVLRLYEIWLKTGSMRARGLLRRLGIEAAPVAMRMH